MRVPEIAAVKSVIGKIIAFKMHSRGTQVLYRTVFDYIKGDPVDLLLRICLMDEA